MFCKAMEMYTVIQIVIAFACAMPAVSKSIYSNETHDDIRKFPLTSMKITGNVNTLQAHKGYRQDSDDSQGRKSRLEELAPDGCPHFDKTERRYRRQVQKPNALVADFNCTKHARAMTPRELILCLRIHVQKLFEPENRPRRHLKEPTIIKEKFDCMKDAQTMTPRDLILCLRLRMQKLTSDVPKNRPRRHVQRQLTLKGSIDCTKDPRTLSPDEMKLCLRLQIQKLYGAKERYRRNIQGQAALKENIDCQKDARTLAPKELILCLRLRIQKIYGRGKDPVEASVNKHS